jgi:hypothetical protein
LNIKDSRKQTFLEQAAADDLDQAELELKLASLKAELQAIKTKMSATMRRRRKLLKAKDVPDYFDADGDSRSEYGDSRDSFLESFTGSIDTFATAEEYDMDVAFRRLRVWSRGQAKFMESDTVVHVRTGSRFEDCVLGPYSGADRGTADCHAILRAAWYPILHYLHQIRCNTTCYYLVTLT